MDRPVKSEPEEPVAGRQDATGSGPAPDSVPLVALVPAHRRPTKHTELGVKSGFITKARGSNEILKPIARHARNPWVADRDIRGRHSAPGFIGDSPLRQDLRESKSAPDLRQPVLAAIRGLQDGSLQVDIRTRAKIAHAARRVLEARELQRRSSHNAKTLQVANLKAPSSALVALAGISHNREVETMEQESAQVVPATPAEVKRGQVDNTAVQLPAAEDHEQKQFGTEQGRQSFPFTVTTGLPRFPQDPVASKDWSPSLSGSRTKSLPSSSLLGHPKAHTSRSGVHNS